MYIFKFIIMPGDMNHFSIATKYWKNSWSPDEFWGFHGLMLYINRILRPYKLNQGYLWQLSN